MSADKQFPLFEPPPSRRTPSTPTCGSNSAGLKQFDPDGREAEAIERALGIAVLRHCEPRRATPLLRYHSRPASGASAARRRAEGRPLLRCCRAQRPRSPLVTARLLRPTSAARRQTWCARSASRPFQSFSGVAASAEGV